MRVFVFLLLKQLFRGHERRGVLLTAARGGQGGSPARAMRPGDAKKIAARAALAQRSMARNVLDRRFSALQVLSISRASAPDMVNLCNVFPFCVNLTSLTIRCTYTGDVVAMVKVCRGCASGWWASVGVGAPRLSVRPVQRLLRLRARLPCRRERPAVSRLGDGTQPTARVY